MIIITMHHAGDNISKSDDYLKVLMAWDIRFSSYSHMPASRPHIMLYNAKADILNESSKRISENLRYNLLNSILGSGEAREIFSHISFEV